MQTPEPVHFTHLKQISLSPMHYRYSADQGFDKACYAAGRITHYLVLGGDYVVYEGKRQGNAWKEFEAEHEATGKEIFTRSEVTKAEARAEAVLRHPIAGPLITEAEEKERHVLWTHETGRRCSSRLDALSGPKRYLLDLKVASSAEPGRFSRAAIRYAYHAQGAFYADAAKSIGYALNEVYLVTVETDPPHPVTVFRVTANALAEGRKLNRLWMERLLACEDSNEWPGYTQSIVDLDVEQDFDLIIEGEPVAA